MRRALSITLILVSPILLPMVVQPTAVATETALSDTVRAGSARAGDWSSWRGGDRSGRIDGFVAPTTWPEKLERGWQVEVGTGHSTPALVGDRLYVHARQKENDEVILCLDATSGKEIWRDTLVVPYEMDPTAEEHGKGPKSSVTVADGRVITLGITGTLSCLDATSGKIIWRHTYRDRFPKPEPRYGSSMTPLVRDGVVYAHIGGDEKGAIVALDAATGEEKWAWTEDGPGYASPIIATISGKEHLITQSRSCALGLSPADGKVLWKMPFATNYDQNSVTPIVAGELVILSGYHKGTAAYTVEQAEPKQVWKTSNASMYMSSPILQDGHIIGFSEKRRGQYFCMKVDTGDIVWTGDSREGENAALVDAGDVILALNTGSELVVFRPIAEEYEELARYEVADSPTWAHPVVSGRTVYIKDETKLTRWTIPDGTAAATAGSDADRKAGSGPK